MSAWRHILLMWLAWSLIVVGFMYAALLRVQPQRPDHALPWTAAETGADSLSNIP